MKIRVWYITPTRVGLRQWLFRAWKPEEHDAQTYGMGILGLNIYFDFRKHYGF